MSEDRRWPDLAARRLGGMTVEASDEFFAAKENLLDPAAPIFVPGRYTDRGKWMDGWETRRRRGPGHDWCIVRLGVPGVVREAVVDTSHFRGNQPESFSLEGCSERADWFELIPRTPLAADAEGRFPVPTPVRVTQVRLNIHPDGGVARLRLYGEPAPDLRGLAGLGALDLAATANGGRVLACSDMSFSAPEPLLMPGDAVDMGDGWETRRRRGPGHDWVVARLAAEGTIERVEVDTTHDQGNFPDGCAVQVCDAPGADGDEVPAEGWTTVVARTALKPHARHVFALPEAVPASHVELDIYPDGGVSRLRVLGRVTDAGWERLGLSWLNRLPAEHAVAELRTCCASQRWAESVAGGRPYRDVAALHAAADEVWRGLDAEEWQRAFAAHPRIGERAGGWSGREQAGVRGADTAVLDALADTNRAYEERFGHVFLICAAGRSAAGMLAALRERLGNDPQTEAVVAAEEQRKITGLRLARLFREVPR